MKESGLCFHVSLMSELWMTSERSAWSNWLQREPCPALSHRLSGDSVPVKSRGIER